MQQVYIKFKDAEQVKRFVNMVDTFEAHCDLRSGRKIVNAKSILGILALDLSEPLQLWCDSDDRRIVEKISPFLLEKAVV